MKNYRQTGNVTTSAEYSGMTAKTASRYIKNGYPDPKDKPERNWRTRADPFEIIWPEVVVRLCAMRTGAVSWVSAKGLFNEFLIRYPTLLNEGMIRTFQRRISLYKQEHECEDVPEIFFEQMHIPGRLMEVDWFHSRELEVIIAGKMCKHLLCHSILSYSNWEWVTVCRSESFASLKCCLQSTLFELGYIPKVLQTDNSSTATHRLDCRTGKRNINNRLFELVDYFGIEFQRIQVGKPNENGDIESQNGHLRRYLMERLVLRGHAEFESWQAYEQWLNDQLRLRNVSRAEKLKHETENMRALTQKRLPEYEEVSCHVNKYGLIRIGKGSYSIPTAWRHLKAFRAHVYESRIELWGNDKKLAEFETNPNESGTRIDYRHMIKDLLKKPGAFERYRYREEFIPGDIWRECYDKLLETFNPKRASKEYLIILSLTLEHAKSQVEECLFKVLSNGQINVERVKEYLGVLRKPDEHKDYVPAVDLSVYDNCYSKGDVI